MCKKSEYCKESGDRAAVTWIIATLIISALHVISGCGAGMSGVSRKSGHPATTSRTLIPSIFPESGFVEGWRMNEKPAFYYRDTLFKRVDGEAELYFPYGFVCLASAFYAYGPNEQTSMYIDIFQMGSRLDAFGIYSNYRSPSAKFIPVGTEGFTTAGQLLFYKDRFFIRIDSFGDESKTAIAMKAAAGRLAGMLGESPNTTGCLHCSTEETKKGCATDNTAPSEIALLCSSKLIDKTQRYLPSGILGSSLLSPALEAKYKTAEGQISGFVVLFPSSREAHDTFEKYRQLGISAGEVERNAVTIGEQSYLVTDEYHGKILVCLYDRYILGIYGIRQDPQVQDARSVALDIINNTVKKRATL
jgi:hypothetical protein